MHFIFLGLVYQQLNHCGLEWLCLLMTQRHHWLWEINTLLQLGLIFVALAIRSVTYENVKGICVG